jgi:hypothetical protein
MVTSLAVLLALWLLGREHTDGGTKPRSPQGSSAPALQAAHGDAGGKEAKVRLQRLDQMPLYFIENRGQLDSRVAFYLQGREKTLYFTEQGVTFVLMDSRRRGRVAKSHLEKASLPPAAEEMAKSDSPWVVKLDFVESDPKAKIAGEGKTPAVISYFKGSREQWKTGLPTWRRVVYSDLWPGIDLVYEGTANRLKYSFRIRPGADPERIRLAYRGATKVQLSRIGHLEVETPTGGFEDDAPSAYQEVDRRRTSVNVAYAVATEKAGRYEYGFDLGPYDRGKALVLDPAVLIYAGYIGGSSDDVGQGIAVDGLGNAYVTGQTESSEATFPVTVGPDLTFNGGAPVGNDAFVAKVNAAGTGLDYAGYIGGSGDDAGQGIAVDSLGNAYVTGVTSSSEATFPVTVGPDLTYNGSDVIGGDAFVAKVNAAGTGLDYAGYIGGSRPDVGRSIAVDGMGNAYVTGQTQSSEATFPVTVGPDLTFNGVVQDAFVAKVNAAGTGLNYAGYIGGSSTDAGNGIAVDGSGSAYVTGYTNSSEATFPVTVGPDLTYNGDLDAFVAKVNAAGTGLDYAGYIGGSSTDAGNGIAVDGLGNAYIAGQTGSSEATFPVTVGPDLTYNGAVDFDAFVAKVNAAGTGLDYAGYIGGSSTDDGFGVAVDGLGNAYVTGLTDSSEATFPVTVGPDLTYNGAVDAFVAKVNASGTGLDYAGYIGGSSTDAGNGIAVDGLGNAYIAGQAGSSETTFPVTVGPDLTFNGGVFFGDAFVAKVAEIAQFEGCGLGFWKRAQHFDDWVPTGFSPNQTLESVFDVPDQCDLDNSTLLQALSFQGGDTGVCGAMRILLRTAVAALLNSAHPDVDYSLTTAEVIADVNAALASGDRQTILALASELDASNNLGSNLCGFPPTPTPTP